MTRIEYSTGVKLRSEYPRIETIFGTLAYWLSLTFGQHGWVYLGGFEPPYSPDNSSKETFTVNNVEYEGRIEVFLSRGNELNLDTNSVHRVGDWRSGLTPAARAKIERELMPKVRELFPLPTRENFAAEIYREAASRAYRGASTEIHKMRSDVWNDKRYSGYSDDIKAGLQLGLANMAKELQNMTFETSQTAY
jgi:hypothetical protein